MFKIFKVIFSKNNIEDGSSGKYATLTSVFFALVSTILTVMNLLKGYHYMAILTAILILGFIIAALFSKKEKFNISHYITAFLCAIIFTVFAVTGGNYGFAILWIILIPIVGYMLVGLKVGFFLSLYFQIFLIILFYTPAAKYVEGYYTQTFMMRFPLLYLASFIAVTILMCQRQNLLNKVHHQAYYDALTNLYNRRKYNEIITENTENTTGRMPSVISMDLNRLKYVNDNLGHDAGDELIRAAASLIRDSFGRDECFRVGGDEFIVVSSRKAEDIQASIQTFKEEMRKWKGKLVDEINISLGTALAEENPGENIRALCILADRKMYEEKERFYRESGYDRRKPETTSSIVYERNLHEC